MIKGSENMLKIIGIAAMTIDHIGLMILPEVKILRIIGRIAMPIFCYLIAEGMKKTKNKENYMVRIGILAIISQIPYMIFVKEENLNILFSFYIAMYCTCLIERYKKLDKLFVILSILLAYFSMSYGFVVPALIFIFYYMKNDKKKYIFATIVMVLYSVVMLSVMQLVSLLALPILYLYKYKFKVNKYLYYAYYPLHLVLIGILGRLI